MTMYLVLRQRALILAILSVVQGDGGDKALNTNEQLYANVSVWPASPYASFESNFTTSGITAGTQRLTSPSHFRQHENQEEVPHTTSAVGRALLSFQHSPRNDSTWYQTSPKFTKPEPVSPCAKVDSTHILTDSEGRLEWTGSHRAAHKLWFVDLHLTQGLVLQFHDVHVHVSAGDSAYDDSLVVYEGCWPDPQRMMQSIAGNALVEPILVRHHRVLIVLKTHQRAFDFTPDLHVLTEPPVTHFILNYTAYPLTALPPRINATFYNCSAPFRIPDAFICDVVQHCFDGEDELGCWYENMTCPEDWLPVGNFCLNLVYTSTPISAAEAEMRCAKERGGLAWFLNVDELKAAARFAALRGNASKVIFGLKSNNMILQHEGLHHLYRFLWHAGPSGRDALIVFDKPFAAQSNLFDNCAVLTVSPVVELLPVECHVNHFHACACTQYGATSFPFINRHNYPQVSRTPNQAVYKKCPDGSFVHKFHDCKRLKEGTPKLEQNSARISGANIPLFECENGEFIHYSLVIDGEKDCSDGSDEVMPLMLSDSGTFACRNSKQLIPVSSRCDGSDDCFDGTDEDSCEPSKCSEDTVFCINVGCLPRIYYERRLGVCPKWIDRGGKRMFSSDQSYNYMRPLHQSRLQIDLDGFGLANITVLKDDEMCPETHIRCKDSYCIPSYMKGNTVFDCPYLSDEMVFTKEPKTCPGHYQCYMSEMCLHADFLCDGIYHCPMKDDERYCNITCPDNCSCEGYAYTCDGVPEMSTSLQYDSIRYLDMSGSSNCSQLPGIPQMNYLKYLNLSNCNLTSVILYNIYLKVLDLSSNSITSLSEITVLGKYFLTHLYLAHNKLLAQPGWSVKRMTGVALFVNLRVLDLRNTSITYIGTGAFSNSTSIRKLDITNNGRGYEFDAHAFEGLVGLQKLQSDDHRLCCLYFHTYPESTMKCSAPASLLSSCEDLLKNNALRAILWLESLLAVAGNVGVLFFRFLETAPKRFSCHRTLIINLCVSDFLMGVYIVIIGSADALYRGQYLWKHGDWTRSVVCTTAGFLAMVSSEVSAFLIGIITLDRFLKVRFPINMRFQMEARSTLAACGVAWAGGLLIATLPLLTEGKDFYGKSGICFPLSISQPGVLNYSFYLFVVFNLSLCVLIGLGQAMVFFSIRRGTAFRNSMPGSRQSQDKKVAGRLFFVVFTDLCCWVPVGVMSLVAVLGSPVPEAVDAWVAVFFLPVNSVLNPFIYTLGAMLQKQRERRQRGRLKRMKSELRAQVPSWSREWARAVVAACLDSKQVGTDWILKCLAEQDRSDRPEIVSVSGTIEVRVDSIP